MAPTPPLPKSEKKTTEGREEMAPGAVTIWRSRKFENGLLPAAFDTRARTKYTPPIASNTPAPSTKRADAFSAGSPPAVSATTCTIVGVLGFGGQGLGLRVEW